jgi:hypothetical protein
LLALGCLPFCCGGAGAGYFFLLFDTSVESGYGRVHNIGLLQDRQNGLILCLVVSAFGFLALIAGVVMLGIGYMRRPKSG